MEIEVLKNGNEILIQEKWVSLQIRLRNNPEMFPIYFITAVINCTSIIKAFSGKLNLKKPLK